MSFSVRSAFTWTILGSLSTSFHPFLTLCGQLKMPEPAGSRSLAGPCVHQESLLPSLYGQIMSLIKRAWLQAPPSPAFPITCPCPCRFSSPGDVSVCAQSVFRSLATNPASLPWSCAQGTAPCKGLPHRGWQTPAGWWGRSCIPTGSREQPCAAFAPRVDGGTGDAPCASEESVILKTQKSLKPSPQLMPIINHTVSVASQNITQCLCKQWMQDEKTPNWGKSTLCRAPPKPVFQDAETPSSLFTKVTFLKSSRAGFSMPMAQQLPV